MNILTVLILGSVIVALIMERILGTITVPDGFYLICSLLVLFTVGYRYFFEDDKKKWGISLMVLTAGGLLFAIVFSFI
ncbi:hypothetical protein [Halobacillus halophilus]|uniref:hypothetical protein n=1 Tax=Halobacillus halophilus TaxID=1570 RepID=UPI001CB9CA5F|nr:hypothetical protein [Halobacillus halophilus]